MTLTSGRASLIDTATRRPQTDGAKCQSCSWKHFFKVHWARMVRLQLPCIPAKGEYVLEYFVSFYCKWTKINPSPPPRRKAMFIYESSKWSWSEGCTERGSACASNTNCQDNDLATWRQLHTRLLPLYRKLTLLLLLISDYSFLPLLPFSLSISRSFRPWLAGAEFPPYFFLSVVEIPLLLLSISSFRRLLSLFLFFLAS